MPSSYPRQALVFDALALLGFLSSWPFNLRYLLNGGSLLPSAFLGAAFANDLATAFTLDLLVSALVFAVFVIQDAARAGVRRPWLYVLLCFGTGLAIAMPLYLARREQARTRLPR